MLVYIYSIFKGAVPKYLTDRKDEWARKEEERIKNLPDPDCPINVLLYDKKFTELSNNFLFYLPAYINARTRKDVDASSTSK